MWIYLKSLIFLFVFSILHFGYEWLGWKILIPFCGIDESVFQHLKMGFWAYIFVSFIEYLILRNRVKKASNFWFSRFFSAIILPWIIILVWYLVPAIYSKRLSVPLEIIWAIFSAYLSSVFSEYFAREIEKINFRLSTKIAILFLLIISAFLFILFSYKLPWVDIFANPQI
jgi:hypothetical protein